ncbi:hypothetical protein Tco_0707099 [Tanacetum coccineum]|uniref:Uncharacterized protein n=1 Tax=Tanacetum coccineum TaxID=301880 RepID=A0ABQ4YAV7_9ASTR
MTTSIVTSLTDSQMHNNILAAGSRDSSHQSCNRTICTIGDHGSYITLIQTKRQLKKCGKPSKATTSSRNCYKPTNTTSELLKHQKQKVDTTPRCPVVQQSTGYSVLKLKYSLSRSHYARKCRKLRNRLKTPRITRKDVDHHVHGNGDSNVNPDAPICVIKKFRDQNEVECDDREEEGERVALANLIANLKLDVDENKKIQKQLKKANATLTQELTECKSILAETSRTLGESNSIRDSFALCCTSK